jgi:hypothetical protein
VRRRCDFCAHCFTPQIESQRFCGPRCRRLGRSLEAKAARRLWAQECATVDEDVRSEFLAERGIWQPEGLRATAAAMVRRR